MADFGDLALGHELEGGVAVFGDRRVDAVPDKQRKHRILGEGVLRHERIGQRPAVFQRQLLQGRGELELHEAGLVFTGHFEETVLGLLGKRSLIAQELEGPSADVFAFVVGLLE